MQTSLLNWKTGPNHCLSETKFTGKDTGRLQVKGWKSRERKSKSVRSNYVADKFDLKLKLGDKKENQCMSVKGALYQDI